MCYSIHLKLVVGRTEMKMEEVHKWLRIFSVRFELYMELYFAFVFVLCRTLHVLGKVPALVPAPGPWCQVRMLWGMAEAA
jgi:hypothetical protein